MMRSKLQLTAVTGLMVVTLGPAVTAQIAACFKNVTGSTACQRAGISNTVTYVCTNGQSCPTVFIEEDSACSSVAGVGPGEPGKNNTLVPVPQRACKWRTQSCVIPQEGGSLTVCTPNPLQTFNADCPEVAGDFCNGKKVPGGDNS